MDVDAATVARNLAVQVGEQALRIAVLETQLGDALAKLAEHEAAAHARALEEAMNAPK